VVFHIKALGDYTSKLPANIHISQSVTVEGPYGRFKFDSDPISQQVELDAPHQVWIAGGIGITPFLSQLHMISESSKLYAPSQKHNTIPITLYYCTRIHDSSFVNDLYRLSKKAHITLHIIASGRDQPLTADRLKQDIPTWLSAHFWFCGPAGLGQSLRDDLVSQGLKKSDFHQELFEMR
jgi:predicted ferric reductase